MTANATLDPAAELERATSDYLAVSRNSHMYATTADYELAERRAWERMAEAAEAVKEASSQN
jgi:MoaA/NifB/PqqE/SkfB family radical SAM enzyme